MYVPEQDAFYKKLIAVGARTEKITRRKVDSELKRTSTNVSKTAATVEARKIEVSQFLNDLTSVQVEFNSIFAKESESVVKIVLDSILKYFQQLKDLFQELQAECRSSYPLLSYALLRRKLCTETHLLSCEQLENLVSQKRK